MTEVVSEKKRQGRSSDVPGESAFQKLVDQSVKNYYNPYREFSWPPSLSKKMYWMSPELLSFFGTEYFYRLDEQQRMALSRHEMINFLSLSVHGIRELLQQVLECIHKPGFEGSSEYFHHFVGEENEHMWFFAQFCLRYGNAIYPRKQLKVSAFGESDINNFISFSQILIFEEIGDFYNASMKEDTRLPDIVRKINRIHHQDEIRHMAMGRRICQQLFKQLLDKYPKKTIHEIQKQLANYISICIESFYNPKAYADSGISEPYDMRRALLSHPRRIDFHKRVTKRVTNFLLHSNILEYEVF